MVYKDQAAFDSWEELGAEPCNHNTMVHVLASSKSATLVVDDPNEPDMKRIIQGMKTYLEGRARKSATLLSA